jgi:hypothetical protein
LLHGLPFLKRFIQILSQYDKRDNYASDLFRGSLKEAQLGKEARARSRLAGAD